jgi:hypothetical protein
VTAKGKPAATLDPVIHPITRLSICGLLASGADWVERSVCSAGQSER